MFFQRKGYRWKRAAHHKAVCDALMRVFRGECTRLIINIPPRYSKTELAVVSFIAWALGQAPDSEFIHVSYASPLAVNNSVQVRTLVQHEAYGQVFPGCRMGSDAKAHWTTTAGGVMYATGAGGTITGFGAGKHRDGFGGCFPYAQLVETERGPIAIGDIVTQRLPVRVWSWNEAEARPELAPIDTFWTNPGNEIVEVTAGDGSSFRCTPNHRVLTSSGWIEARHLAQPLDLVDRQPGFLHGLLSRFRGVGRHLHNAALVLRLGLPMRVGQFARHVGPGKTQLDLPNDAAAYTEAPGQLDRRFGTAEDRQRIGARQLGTGPALKDRKRSVPQSVLHVLGLGAPLEIAARVVARVAVQVSGFLARLAVARKRLQNKMRDVAHRDDAAHGQVDPEITLAVGARLEQPQWDGAAHGATVGNFIKPFGAGNRKPPRVVPMGQASVTFCLEVRGNHNFILAQSGAIVSNCIIIDDPHKPDEARSDVMRQGVIDWFQNTLESRQNAPGRTPIILIMQRLHEHDLAGWLLGDRGKDGRGPPVPGGNGEVWEHICLPAITDDGQALWPEKHGIEALRRMERAAPYVFAGQYLQRPAPPQGGVFKPDQLQVIDALPAGPIEWVRGWDLAATAESARSADPDYTAGGKLGKLQDGRYVIADMVRLRAGPDERDAALKNTAARDGTRVKQSLPQDPGQAGKTQALHLTRMLAGYSVHTSPESGDKVQRAEPLASQVNVGNVLLLRGAWNDELINEMRLFPNGTHDDQVDALSRASEALMGGSTGMLDWARQQAEAAQAATEQGKGQ